jgi:hypothetical protein
LGLQVRLVQQGQQEKKVRKGKLEHQDLDQLDQ